MDNNFSLGNAEENPATPPNLLVFADDHTDDFVATVEQAPAKEEPNLKTSGLPKSVGVSAI